MANEVEWIKLTTDMFDNGKIKQIRALPDGNNIVLLWIMLLTMAGKCNAGGMIILTENVPYTVEMIANETGIPKNTVTLGIETLERLKMICRDNEVFLVKNWYEYQSEDGLEKIREQTRIRTAKYRERKKVECDVTRDVTVTQVSTSYSYSNNSNINNYKYLLETYKDKEYIEEHSELSACIKDWLEYKDERKPKRGIITKAKKALQPLLINLLLWIRNTEPARLLRL